MASVVKINVLTVGPEMRAELERRFSGRAGLVESADGFEGFELLRPVEGTDRYMVYTRWRSEADYQRWLESDAFRHGHAQAAQDAQDAAAPAGGPAGHGHGHGKEQAQGHGHGHGHGGPAAAAAELWSFEVVQSAGPKA